MVEKKGKVVTHIKDHIRATKAHVSPPLMIKAKANPNTPTTKEKGKANPNIDHPAIAPLNPVAIAKSLVTRHANAEKEFTTRKTISKRLPTPITPNTLTFTSMKRP
jgi:hypothetical protein